MFLHIGLQFFRGRKPSGGRMRVGMRILAFVLFTVIGGLAVNVNLVFAQSAGKGKADAKAGAKPAADTGKKEKEVVTTRSRSGAVQFEALRIETEKEGPGVIFIDNWTPSTKREFDDEAKSELDRVFMDIRGLNRSFDRRIKQAPDVTQIQRENAARDAERRLLSLDQGRVKTDRATVQR